MPNLRTEIVAGVLLLLCGCAPWKSPGQIEADSMLEAKRAALARDIGAHFWPAKAAGLCVRDTLDVMTDCHNGLGEFVVDGVTPVNFPPAVWIHVKFATGLSGSFPISVDVPPDEWLTDHDILREPMAYPLFLNKLDKKEADRRRKLPGVLVGSMMDDVPASAWGEPLEKKQKALRGPGRYDVSVVDTWIYTDSAKITFLDRRAYQIER